uniref:Uncharacterized protein n=1 Tax=Tanacetum cinerariifolium TaxID=118510 RepID=A0A699GWX6_TANCI|nr:hypothetical protein [Tanacetum cinerariifolium]
MANVTFADSHNMVAYLEKSPENANFAEIIDFLNVNPIRVERAATTTASLDVEQDSGTINRTQSTAIPNEPIPQGTNLEDAEIQGRYGDDIEITTTSTSITTTSINITTAEPITTVSASITTVGVFVSTAEPCTPTITTTVIEDKDLIIA